MSAPRRFALLVFNVTFSLILSLLVFFSVALLVVALQWEPEMGRSAVVRLAASWLSWLFGPLGAQLAAWAAGGFVLMLALALASLDPSVDDTRAEVP